MGFIAQSLSCSPFHRLKMTEILLKGRKTLTHPSIFLWESKKISNDQELIQSDPISCPQNQKGNN